MVDAECEVECEPDSVAECEDEYKANSSTLVTATEPGDEMGRITDLLAY